MSPIPSALQQPPTCSLSRGHVLQRAQKLLLALRPLLMRARRTALGCGGSVDPCFEPAARAALSHHWRSGAVSTARHLRSRPPLGGCIGSLLVCSATLRVCRSSPQLHLVGLQSSARHGPLYCLYGLSQVEWFMGGTGEDWAYYSRCPAA